MNLDDPRTQMLMTMGLGLLGGQSDNFGQNLGRAGLLGLNAYNQGSALKARLEEEKQQREMRAMQMAEMQRAREAQAYMGQGIGKFMNPGVQPATAVDDSGLPMPSSPPSFNQAGFASYLAQNPATAQQALQFMPKPEVPEYLESAGRVFQKTADGLKPVVEAPPPKSKRELGDLRTYKVGRVEYTDEWDGSKWVNKGRSAIDKPEDGPGLGKPPQGYRWRSDGALEPIPGGPADTKVGKEAEALGKRQEGAMQRADFVLGKISDAIKKTGVTTSGALGSVMRNVPGTDARALQRILDPIKANIGFAELQAMREASPTGGALGQVAVQELNMLQSVLGSLEQDQPPAELLKSLYSIEKHFNNWKRAVQASKQANKQDGGWSIQKVD